MNNLRSNLIKTICHFAIILLLAYFTFKIFELGGLLWSVVFSGVAIICILFTKQIVSYFQIQERIVKGMAILMIIISTIYSINFFVQDEIRDKVVFKAVRLSLEGLQKERSILGQMHEIIQEEKLLLDKLQENIKKEEHKKKSLFH